MQKWSFITPKQSWKASWDPENELKVRNQWEGNKTSHVTRDRQLWKAGLNAPKATELILLSSLWRGEQLGLERAVCWVWYVTGHEHRVVVGVFRQSSEIMQGWRRCGSVLVHWDEDSQVHSQRLKSPKCASAARRHKSLTYRCRCCGSAHPCWR